MGKKVYAVRKGAIPGIYATWAECEAQVRGVSGAEYKSFKREAEARAWLGGVDILPAQVSSTSATASRNLTSFSETADDLPPWDLPEEQVGPVPALRQDFHLGVAIASEVSTRSPWDIVEHYYSILHPYADLRFDFVAFARALKNAAPDAPNPEAVRFDFDQIEAAYRQLRPQSQ